LPLFIKAVAAEDAVVWAPNVKVLVVAVSTM
jgi:hypothetical protein